MERALQDIMPGQCFGCGAHNERGLQIKSFWLGDEVVCAWRAQAHHTGHPGILYGGMIASVVDCHCIWTAVAWAHRHAGVEISETPRFQYVTAALNINFRKPVAIAEAIELRARVTEFSERKAIVRCLATSTGQLCADAEVVAVPMREPQSVSSDSRHSSGQARADARMTVGRALFEQETRDGLPRVLCVAQRHARNDPGGARL